MKPILVLPEEGDAFSAFGDTIQFKICGGQSGNDITIGYCTAAAGGGPPLHIHHREHEIFIVESGEIEVLVEGEWTKAPPRSVVFLPKEVPHQFRNATDSPARFWVICAPSGFEKFYEQASGIFNSGGLPDIGMVMQAAMDHGLEILGPPPGH